MVVSQKVGDRRLLKLARILENVPPDKFNLDRWAGFDDDQEGRRKPNYQACGFAACAVGWAAHDRSFQRAGFKLSFRSVWHPTFKGLRSFDAVLAFFGLSQWEDSFYLFSMERYPNRERTRASEVSDRIRKYVQDRNR